MGKIQAFIFGAGFGERLLPLTAERPKVTVPVLAKPNIFYIIENLCSIGVTDFIINTHHKADTLKAIVGDGRRWNVSITYSDEAAILETGGGLKHAERYITAETFIAYNGDIFCDVDLSKALAFHAERNAIATMVVSPHYSPRQLHIGRLGNLKDIRAMRHYHSTPPTHTFLGIHLFNREIFSYLPEKKSSIINTYMKLLESNKPVFIWELDSEYWYDIGSIDVYKKLHADFFNHYPSQLKARDTIYNTDNSRYGGYISVAENVLIEDDVSLKNVIIWENAVIKAGSVLDNVIVRNDTVVTGNHTNVIL